MVLVKLISTFLGETTTPKPDTRPDSTSPVNSNITFVFNISFVIVVNAKLQLLYREVKRILTLFRVPKISIRSHSGCCGGKIGLGYPWLKKLYFPKS